MLGRCSFNRALDFRQRLVRSRQINLLRGGRCADIAGYVEVEIVLFDLHHLHPTGVARLFFAELIGLDDFGDVLGIELVLAFAFFEVLGSVDEEHVVGLLALLEDEDADRDAGGIEQIGGQADGCPRSSAMRRWPRRWACR